MHLVCNTFLFICFFLLGKDLHLDEDEQLARAIQESLNVESPPRPHENASPPRARENSAHPRARENGNANGGNSYQQLPFMFSSGFRFVVVCYFNMLRFYLYVLF